ncbi:MAG: hypothetical protein L0Y61_05710 [Epsilonproteobacteria bacterium]|nr:hypothetical protein [Campylobacterota bacterium]
MGDIVKIVSLLSLNPCDLKSLYSFVKLAGVAIFVKQYLLKFLSRLLVCDVVFIDNIFIDDEF